MSLSRTLVGALIGAVVGIVLHTIVVVLGRSDAFWFAIVIGLLAGLGARKYNKALAERVSYASGALAAVIALAAIVGSVLLAPTVRAKTASMFMKAATPSKEQPSGAGTVEEEEPAGETTAFEPVGETTGVPAEQPKFNPTVTDKPDLNVKDFIDVWQIIFVAIGTYLAYELARGKNGLARPATTV